MKFFILTFLISFNVFGKDVLDIAYRAESKMEVVIEQRRLLNEAYKTLAEDCDNSGYDADLISECKAPSRIKKLKDEFRSRYNVDKDVMLNRGQCIVDLRKYIDTECIGKLQYNKTETCSQLKDAIISVNRCE